MEIIAHINIANESPEDKRRRFAGEKAAKREEFKRRLAEYHERGGAP